MIIKKDQKKHRHLVGGMSQSTGVKQCPALMQSTTLTDATNAIHHFNSMTLIPTTPWLMSIDCN